MIGDIEVHSVDGIRDCFDNGVSPNDIYRGEPLIYELTSEYLRSDRFKDCVKMFVDFGLKFPDKTLLAVLLDDAAMLEQLLQDAPEWRSRHYTLRCAYTPLFEVTLLHICAEYNHLACAEVLVKLGADVNAKAGVDEHGFGRQTPIFHTVNQNQDHSRGMMNFLISHGADLTTTIQGIIWGKSYPWETLIPSVNPISYAMMGLLPQMHRSEIVISHIVSALLKSAYDIEYYPPNVPNKYLKG